MASENQVPGRALKGRTASSPISSEQSDFIESRERELGVSVSPPVFAEWLDEDASGLLYRAGDRYRFEEIPCEKLILGALPLRREKEREPVIFAFSVPARHEVLLLDSGQARSLASRLPAERSRAFDALMASREQWRSRRESKALSRGRSGDIGMDGQIQRAGGNRLSERILRFLFPRDSLAVRDGEGIVHVFRFMEGKVPFGLADGLEP